MISAKKLEANRRNGQRSTGPKTDEGKAVASRNSLKHGLYTSNPLLPGEDPAEFALFGEGLLKALKPADEVQLTLADRVVTLAWKLRRVGDIEDAVVRQFLPGWNPDETQWTAAEHIADFFAGKCDSMQMDHVANYEHRLQRSFQSALRQLKQIQKIAREDGEDVTCDTGLRPVQESVEDLKCEA